MLKDSRLSKYGNYENKTLAKTKACVFNTNVSLIIFSLC